MHSFVESPHRNIARRDRTKNETGLTQELNLRTAVGALHIQWPKYANSIVTPCYFCNSNIVNYLICFNIILF